MAAASASCCSGGSGTSTSVVLLAPDVDPTLGSMMNKRGTSALSTLSLRVTTRMGRALASPFGATFDATGGTIGRAPDCTLVLDDPGRHISRRQARVEFRDGDWRIVALGASNPLFVDGGELAPGTGASLFQGVRIGVAEYEMVVEIGAVVPSVESASGVGAAPPTRHDAANLIAEDFDPFAEPVDEPAPGADPAWHRPAIAVGPDANAPRDHPLAAQPSAFDDPFAGPDRGDGPDVDVPARPQPAVPSGGGSSFEGELDYQRRRDSSIDALFGLGESGPPPGGELFRPTDRGKALADGLLEAAGEPLDPLEALARADRQARGDGAAGGSNAARRPGMGGAATDGTVGDVAPALAGVMRLPEAIPQNQADIRPGPSTPQAALLPPAPAAPVFSWEQSALAAPPAPPALAERREPLSAVGPGAREATADKAASEAVHGSAAPDALLRALLEGAGLLATPAQAAMTAPHPSREWLPRELTPALMRQLGETLLAAADGTVALLAARSTVKREMKAPLTVIEARDNNPLKFAPDGMAAVHHLLSNPPMRGFMAGPDAMRDACEDLLAHQLAWVAGVRAALHGLLQRFEPLQLEGLLDRKGALAAKLPGRRARLWDVFVERFSEISTEAQDDFERLFGEAFVAAYQAQLLAVSRDREHRT